MSIKQKIKAVQVHIMHINEALSNYKTAPENDFWYDRLVRYKQDCEYELEKLQMAVDTVAEMTFNPNWTRDKDKDFMTYKTRDEEGLATRV